MKKLLLIASVFFVWSSVAEIKINKVPKRKPAQASNEDKMADAAFLGFLGCGKFKGKHAELERCVQQLFATGTGTSTVRRYIEALSFPNEYSELFECPAEMKKTVTAFEDKDYDTYRCFDSNIVSSGRIGVVFFKREGGALRIMRMKM